MYLYKIFFGIFISFLLLLILYLIEHFFRKATGIKEARISSLYQGGEVLSSEERLYEFGFFNLILLFLILHVLGFYIATIYVISLSGYPIFNWLTISFSTITLYIAYSIGKQSGAN